MKQKANILIWTLGLKCDNGFDLGHDIDIWIFKVICDLDHLVTKVRCKDLPDSDRGDFRCRRAVDSSSWSDWLSYTKPLFLSISINIIDGSCQRLINSDPTHHQAIALR